MEPAQPDGLQAAASAKHLPIITSRRPSVHVTKHCGCHPASVRQRPRSIAMGRVGLLGSCFNPI